MTFNVEARGLRTKGTVVVDALISYYDYLEAHAKEIYYHRHMVNGVMRSAARDFQNDGTGDSHYDTITVTSISGIDYDPRMPSHVSSIMVVDKSGSVTKNFLTGDIIPDNYNMVIQLATSENIDNIAVKKNGENLNVDAVDGFIQSNGVITIYALGSGGNTLTIDGYLGPTQLDTITIDYEVASGREVKDFYAGPSPYEPDTGDMYFGFQSTQTCTWSLYVYDASGKMIYELKDQAGVQGFNKVSWDGTMISAGKIGRGFYLARIVADFSGKKKVYSTKFGVK